MQIPVPEGHSTEVSRRHLGVVLTVAVGTAMWVFGAPLEAREAPHVTWTFPLVAAAVYCWAKDWPVGAGLHIVLAVLMLAAGSTSWVSFPDEHYMALSLVAVAGTAVSAVTLEVARWRWRESLRGVTRDPRTGLARRWLFDWYLQKAAAAAQRGKQVSLVLFGVRSYDRSPDIEGDRETGSDWIAELGALVRETCRVEDFVARYDQNRFAALLYGEDEDSASAFAHRVRRQIEFADAMAEQGCIASAGVAEYDPEAFETAEEFVRAAERALSSANYAGGNRVIVYGSKSFRQAQPQSTEQSTREAS